MSLHQHTALHHGGHGASRPDPLFGLGTKTPQVATTPSRARTKLWELNATVHCSIIGTCLTTAELRKLMGKIAGKDVAHFSDHDLHADGVSLCNQHNAHAKLLQKALDLRHQTVIKQFARLQTEAAVLEKWREAQRAGDIPGAYWAVLTHPETGHAGLRQAFGDVHMLSHLVGAANRADIRRLARLEEENAALRDKVERQQLRLQQAVTSRDVTIRTLAAPHPTTTPDEERDALHHLVAELQTRLSAEIGRRQRLEHRLEDATKTHQRLDRRARTAEADHAALRAEIALLETPTEAPDAAVAVGRILYVGGRPGALQQMRATMEAAGGALLCHDGGQHDHPSLLPGLISQADRVVFPVDCVSHDAALTVKRVCRQLGKRWLPLRSSGLASFLVAMAAA
jgi:hypothetical protein